jgi:hypothetical protein
MANQWRIAVLAGVFALATACGGGTDDGGDDVASVSGKDSAGQQADDPKLSDEDMQRAFAKCMREHGVDMPDPKPGEMAALPAMPVDGDDSKEGRALKACEKYLPDGGEMKPPTAEELDEMRRQAQCLRDHGLNVPDPTEQNPGLAVPMDGDQAAVEKAMEACGMGGAVTVPKQGG